MTDLYEPPAIAMRFAHSKALDLVDTILLLANWQEGSPGRDEAVRKARRQLNGIIEHFEPNRREQSDAA